MIPLAKTATPAAKAVLRQATALKPKRKKASDGLLPSAAHVIAQVSVPSLNRLTAALPGL